MMANPVGYLGALLFLGLALHAATRSAASQNQTDERVTAHHPARLACDFAYSLADEIPGISIQRSMGVFTDEALLHPVRGCGLAITGSFADAPPGEDATSRMRDGFTAQGWQEMLAYSADGKDGTAFVFRKAGVACLFRGTWNGGADDEPSTPREEVYGVSVLCTSPVFPEEKAR
jgi:hypothetical protein